MILSPSRGLIRGRTCAGVSGGALAGGGLHESEAGTGPMSTGDTTAGCALANMGSHSPVTRTIGSAKYTGFVRAKTRICGKLRRGAGQDS